MNKLLQIAKKIFSFNKKRDQASVLKYIEILKDDLLNMNDALQKLKYFKLPFSYSTHLKKFLPERCKVMDSKKLPLWLCLENSVGEEYLTMFKYGDDLR